RLGDHMIGRIIAQVLWKAVPPNRPPDFLIGPSKEDPYMRRWWIIPRNRFFNIYLHHMIHDDDDRAPHDHPWWSLSLCLHGRIVEYRRMEDGTQRVYSIRQGMWKWRGKTYAHRLTFPEGEAWTLFI